MNRIIFIHFESTGLGGPPVSIELVSAVGPDYVIENTMGILLQPPPNTAWEEKAVECHKLSPDWCNSYGYTYDQANALVRDWIGYYKQLEPGLHLATFQDNFRYWAYRLTGQSLEHYWGVDKHCLLDVWSIIAHYMIRAGAELSKIKYMITAHKIAKLLGIPERSGSAIGQGGYTVPTRGRAVLVAEIYRQLLTIRDVQSQGGQ